MIRTLTFEIVIESTKPLILNLMDEARSLQGEGN
jgi:hypothetical protein